MSRSRSVLLYRSNSDEALLTHKIIEAGHETGFANKEEVERIDKIANQLVQTHPESAETILAKQEKINKLWTQLTEAKRRKETSKLQKFLHGHNNLMAFMSWTMDLVSLTTEAKSATAFEVLNKEYQENRKESDGHAERFKALVEFGNQLFYSSHYASREIRETLEQLEQKRKDMDQLIECQNGLNEDLNFTAGLIIFCLDCSNWKSDRKNFPITVPEYL